MTRHVPPADLSEARDAQESWKSRRARSGGVDANTGQDWARKDGDGTLFRIAGRKTSAWVLVNDEAEYVHVGLDELADEWEFVGCDHKDACCTIHGTHTSPHMGCILR